MKKILTRKAKQKTPTTPDESILWIHLFSFIKIFLLVQNYPLQNFISILGEEV